MIKAIISWSIKNRILVLLLATIISAWGVYAVRNIPLDAIPDLSDVQVIIKTTYPGQAPQVVEDQVTYPLSSAMLSVPGAIAVRGYSFFNDSYVYIIFEDGTDPYWARSRVLEYLSQVAPQLPKEAQTALGPDATGVGWIYEYALIDRSGNHDLSELRSIQDWFLKYELQTVPGVSEIATIGGMVKQYQIELDPNRLMTFSLPLSKVKKAVIEANRETGGSVIEMAEAEYMIRSKGYLKNIEDIEKIPPLALSSSGSVLTIKDIATVQKGPQLRRGIAELNGEGEVVGGIAIMRYGENALDTINSIKQKIETLRKSLPDGVEIVETYDRSGLITRAVKTLERKLIEEFIIVVLVCAIFLFHFRSSLVILISLPVGILVAFIIMHTQGVNSNIMSLGGIAIAIGAMVDAAIVMIENVHKHLEKTADQTVSNKERIKIISNAALEVGPPLFFSLLIITLSFLPVFTLEAQEGRLFTPLAFTKTYAMAAAAAISITLVPVLMVFLIRGNIAKENANPINRWLISVYKPLITRALSKPLATLAISITILLSGFIPFSQLGSEFMPELDEGDLLYMPTTFPGISVGKARELLQQTDKLIRTQAEVKQVFGKVGRAETATDPAPLTMIETTIQLKPQSEWRKGMTMEKIKQELDALVQVPSLNNAWLMPIKTRIDMQSTGINTPIGIKISGPDLNVIQSIGQKIEPIISSVDGTQSVYSERSASARYIDVEVDRKAAGRFMISVSELQDIINTAVGGLNVTQTIEGRERYPVNMRYPRHYRDSLEKLRTLPIITLRDEHIQLQDVARIEIADGPPVIKSENARLNGWVFINIKDRDIGSYVTEAKQQLHDKIDLPSGYTLTWTGQYEYMLRAQEKLAYIVPLTIIIIFLLLYLVFRNFTEAFIVLGAVPLALTGGFWLLYLLDYHMSVAVGVGFIALAGVAAEFGVVMLVYLNEAVNRTKPKTWAELQACVIEGAVLRVRPKTMTVAVIIAGLMPIMIDTGTGSEVMRRIATPMIGGMITAPIVSMFLIPVLYLLWQQRKLKV